MAAKCVFGSGRAGFSAIPVPWLKAATAISGHISYSDAEQRLRPLGLEPVYFSAVRDPIERMISGYTYVAMTPHNRLHEEVKAMTFAEFVRSDGIQGRERRGQCGILTGDPQAGAASAIEFIREHYLVVGVNRQLRTVTDRLGAFIGKPLVLETKNVTEGAVRIDLDSKLCAEMLERTGAGSHPA